MSTFDFKSATPDTSFPANGFLFGADSQSASDPSIYSHTAYLNYILSLANTWTATQTVTPAANTSALTVSGYSLTGSDTTPLLNLAGTWNTTGVAKGILLNITDTASNASALLMDLQVGGTSRALFTKAGNITFGTAATANDIIGSGSAVRISSSGAARLGIRGSDNGVAVRDIGYFGFGSSGDVVGTTDVTLYRDAADTLALRRTTNAQTLRAYFSYTDASNYTRLALKTATTIHTIETESAGTGEANIDLALTPKGTGRVRYGTHSAVGAETVTGYITIKDSGGTERKLAVIS